jgi:hypothetical protein
MEKMTRIKAIKTFFEASGGRKVGMQEMKKLTDEDKDELGKLACNELGVQLVSGRSAPAA